MILDKDKISYDKIRHRLDKIILVHSTYVILLYDVDAAHTADGTS